MGDGVAKTCSHPKFIDPELEVMFHLIYYIEYTMFVGVFTFHAHSPYPLSSSKRELLHTRILLIHMT